MISIKVCGNEVISLKKLEPLKVIVYQSPGAKFSYDDVTDLFKTSDPLCKVDSYKLYAKTGSALYETAIVLNGNKLSIDKTNPLLVNFELQA
jgi:hypothetical protein